MLKTLTYQERLDRQERLARPKQRRINLQHFTFSPKYRRSVLAGAVARDTEKMIRHICQLKGMKIHAIAIQPDHVHVFTEIPKTMSVAKAAYWIKWFSSCHVRRLHPQLKSTVKQSALWQHNYFSRSVGGDQRHVQKYIDQQSHR